MKETINIGVSSCLLGLEVRHDGSHKRDRFITDILSEHFDFIAHCPEMAIGLGLPRPAIRLQTFNNKVHLVDSKNHHIDHTDAMIESSQAYVKQMQPLSGYILKSKSPSCGMERVNLYNDSGMPQKTGVGLFASELMKAYPDLPVEEEGRLHDAGVRENFIQRVYAYNRWQCISEKGLSVASLMEFHKRHKLILMAHDEPVYRNLGKLVATTRKENLPENAAEYISQFMQAIKKRATRKRHVNVLQHTMGYLKKHIDRDDKHELLHLFERYARGEIPLVVPITMLKYHFRKTPQDYINEQFYMSPYPENLMLRNHV
jgi:uncharacterized protein YbgA (DUF1722 family)/uncharacterized protein YbbK (DUF523 family)